MSGMTYLSKNLTRGEQSWSWVTKNEILYLYLTVRKYSLKFIPLKTLIDLEETLPLPSVYSIAEALIVMDRAPGCFATPPIFAQVLLMARGFRLQCPLLCFGLRFTNWTNQQIFVHLCQIAKGFGACNAKMRVSDNLYPAFKNKYQSLKTDIQPKPLSSANGFGIFPGCGQYMFVWMSPSQPLLPPLTAAICDGIWKRESYGDPGETSS